MKKIVFVQLLGFLVIATIVVSCVEDNFDIPDVTVESPNIDGDVITLVAFESLYEQALLQEGQDLGIVDFEGNILDAADFAELRGDFQFTFQNDGGNVYTSGYVISSDEASNFFEELVLQDAPENPTVGLRLLIDLNPLFTRYEMGRRVFIRLNGLTAGISNGVFTIGVAGDFIEAIASFEEEDRLTRDVEVAIIVPRIVPLTDLSDDLTNLYISVENVQFNRDLVVNANLTYAGEATDEFDGERLLESCDNNGTVIFSTSTFADFKSAQLPSGRGSIAGVLTRNFFGDEFNLVVNDPSTVLLDQEDRCDPEEVDCGLATSVGSNIIYEDFFEDQDTNELITGNGWTNFIQEGTEGWEAFFSTGTNSSIGISARVGSFQSGDDSNIAWLVTPQFDFDAQSEEVLTYMTSNSFADGSTLEILFSDDWDGVPENIPSASWDLITQAFIVEDDDFFGDFFPSGDVSLDCVTGVGYIGFRYTGSGDEGFDGTYELDEFQLRSN